MTDEFPHDPDLEAALRSRSGGDVALGDAHAAVLGRSHAIRRRRLAAVGGAAAVLIVGGVALAGVARDGADPAGIALDLPGTTTTAPGGAAGVPGATVADDGAAASTSTVAGTDDSSTTTTSTPDGAQPEASTSTTSPDAPRTTSTTSLPGAPAPTTSTAPRPTTTVGGPSTTSSLPSTSTSSPTSTTAPIAPFTKTYDSAGGSITVNWNGTALSLVSAVPAAGFETEVENAEQYRVRVRFRSDVADDSRIEVRINDGRLVEEIW